MSEDIKKIGDVLKGKREEMNFSIKEVESSTSIRSSYLEAIEGGLNDKFLSNVYMFGFIRQYASFLDLNMDSLSKEFPEIFKPLSDKHSFTYGIGTLEVRSSMGGGAKWFSNAVWVGAIAVGLALVWQLFKKLGWI